MLDGRLVLKGLEGVIGDIIPEVIRPGVIGPDGIFFRCSGLLFSGGGACGSLGGPG